MPGQLRIAFASLMGGVGVWIALSTVWSIWHLDRCARSSGFSCTSRSLWPSPSCSSAATVRESSPGCSPASRWSPRTGSRRACFRTDSTPTIDPLNPYRLAEPLGYWNAFGLFTAIGVILVVGRGCARAAILACNRRGSDRSDPRDALYFAFSRGSWLALFLGLAAAVALDPRRVTVLWTLLVLAPAVGRGVAVASRQEAITTEDAPSAAAAREGHRLAWLIAGMIVCSAALGWIAHRFARARTDRDPAFGSVFAAVLAAGAVGAASLVVGGRRRSDP